MYVTRWEIVAYKTNSKAMIGSLHNIETGEAASEEHFGSRVLLFRSTALLWKLYSSRHSHCDIIDANMNEPQNCMLDRL